MQDRTAGLQILTLGALAPGHEYDAFIAIARDARLRSQALGISGLSLFDGQRICAQVRGEAPAVNIWRRETQTDARQALQTVLFEQPFDASTMRVSWAVGYCDSHEFDIFAGPDALRGEAALHAWQGLLARCHLSS